jgi:hypothetical protein
VSVADAAAAARRRLRFLLIDPSPGSLVVFPSFVPHFVAPCANPASRGTSATGGGDPEHTALRVSVAANF